MGGGAPRARGGGRRGHPARRAGAVQGAAHPGDPGGAGRRRPGPDGARAARAGARGAVRAARRRAQDRGLRAAVRVRPPRRAGGHPRAPGGHPPRPVPAGRAAGGVPRRAAAPVRARGPVRVAHGADPPRPPAVRRALAAVRGVPAAAACAPTPGANRRTCAEPRASKPGFSRAGPARAGRHRRGVGPDVRDGAGRDRRPAHDGVPGLPLRLGGGARRRRLPRPDPVAWAPPAGAPAR